MSQVGDKNREWHRIDIILGDETDKFTLRQVCFVERRRHSHKAFRRNPCQAYRARPTYRDV